MDNSILIFGITPGFEIEEITLNSDFQKYPVLIGNETRLFYDIFY
jgi:hypothetical protein